MSGEVNGSAQITPGPLWETRTKAIADLAEELAAEARALDEFFALLDRLLADYEKFFVVDSDFARICALITVKGRNLAVGCYSLDLDGLAQESGALLRPLLETIELLEYVRVVPTGTSEVLDSRLPKPGERAKKIGGKFKGLRDQLNEHACHITFTYDQVRHLINSSTGNLQVVQPHRANVLRSNMASIFLFTSMLALEAAQCFSECAAKTGTALVIAESHQNKIIRAETHAQKLFFPEVSS